MIAPLSIRRGPDLAGFLTAAAELGYSRRVASGKASQVAMRLRIQTGKALTELTDADLDEFTTIGEWETARGKPLKHYYATIPPKNADQDVYRLAGQSRHDLPTS